MSTAHTMHNQSTGGQGWRGGASARVSEVLDKGISEGILGGAVVVAAQHGRFTVQICREGCGSF